MIQLQRSVFTHIHPAVTDVPKEAMPILYANGYEIRTGMCITKILQTD